MHFIIVYFSHETLKQRHVQRDNFWTQPSDETCNTKTHPSTGNSNFYKQTSKWDMLGLKTRRRRQELRVTGATNLRGGAAHLSGSTLYPVQTL